MMSYDKLCDFCGEDFSNILLFQLFSIFEHDLTFDMLKKRRPGSQKRITGTDNVGKEWRGDVEI